MFIRLTCICGTFDRPLNDMTATEVLASEGRCSNFARALELTGVGDMLDKKGPYTVFAPNDDMFNPETLGTAAGAAAFTEILRRFIVPGKYVLSDVRRRRELVSVSGHPLAIEAGEGTTVNGAGILRPDLPYDRGIIHEIGPGW